MRESLVRAFFEGTASPAELASDLVGTQVAAEPHGFRSSANYHIEPMHEEYSVRPEHLVRLVDSVLSGALSLAALHTLVFCIEASDRWRWDADTPDGARVADSLFWLGTPEINYPLSPMILHRIRVYLLTGHKQFTAADTRAGRSATGEA